VGTAVFGDISRGGYGSSGSHQHSLNPPNLNGKTAPGFRTTKQGNRMLLRVRIVACNDWFSIIVVLQTNT
jgi:hypothetical protein